MLRLFFLLLATVYIGQCYAHTAGLPAAALTAQTPQLELDARWGRVGFTNTMKPTMMKPVPAFSLPGMGAHLALGMQSEVAKVGADRAPVSTLSYTTLTLSYTTLALSYNTLTPSYTTLTLSYTF
jgi:hypothetical protein